MEAFEPVHVYGKVGCVQCKYTAKLLDEHGVPYTYHDTDEEPDAAEVVAATQRFQLPYVTTADDSWHGFRPDKLRGLAVVKPDLASPADSSQQLQFPVDV